MNSVPYVIWIYVSELHCTAAWDQQVRRTEECSTQPAQYKNTDLIAVFCYKTVA